MGRLEQQVNRLQDEVAALRARLDRLSPDGES
jgi:uncharacterized protein YceH (UPF0502 family)